MHLGPPQGTADRLGPLPQAPTVLSPVTEAVLELRTLAGPEMARPTSGHPCFF